MKNKQWILKRFPVGEISEGDLVLEENEVPSLSDSQILIRNIYLSLDPANRGWMSGQRSYVDAMQTGDIMRGGTIGIIEESKNEKFKKGEIVNCMGGWQQFCVSDGKGVRQIPQGTGFPLDSYMSILGMTGLTAYFGLLDITDPQPGETLVVSAAAGAVGSIVCQIGKIKGCRVVGIAGSDTKCKWLVDELGIDSAINYKSENIRQRLKENCPDVRNTKVIDVVSSLEEYGIDITIYDPWANSDEVLIEYGLKSIRSLPIKKFDAIILTVAHNEFKDLDLESLCNSKSVVYDVKNFLPNNKNYNGL